MLRQKYLKFKGIGRFVDEQVIIFDTLGKFVQLAGQNNNTKGSSGAGKSTVFMALDYLFGFSNRPSTILKSRYSEEGIWVEGCFDYDGQELIVTRGKKLSITLNGVKTEGSSAITEEKLDGILGMPRELFRKMLHKRQKEGGFFLDMKPADVNDFLMSALKLTHVKDKIKIVDDKHKELTDNNANLVSSLTAARSALQATEDAILSMGLPPIRDIHQSVVLELKGKADKSNAAYQEMATRHKLELANVELSRPKLEVAYFDRSRISALESELSSLKGSQEQLIRIEKDRQTKALREYSTLEYQVKNIRKDIEQGKLAMQRITEIGEQLKKIKEGKCFNCGQDWKDAQQEEQLRREALQCRGQYQAANKATEELPALEVKLQHISVEIGEKPLVGLQPINDRITVVNADLIEERNRERAHQDEQNKKNKFAQDTFAHIHRSTLDQHRLEIEQVRGQADIDRRAFEAAVGKLKAYEEARSRHEQSFNALKAQEASYKEKVVNLTVSANQAKELLGMNEELKRGLKSYLSCSFDEALDTISKNATDLIRHIPNMANATIQLEGVRETQDGKIKEEVNAVIHMDGEQNIDIRSLCGGERTALDLAIDLSVIDLLENRANKGIDLFILDEPFDGLDTVCIEMALEVLKNSNSNKRLIIVDHNPEVKEMVESRLTVVRDGATSRVVQAA